MMKASVRSIVDTAYQIKPHFACALKRVVSNRSVQIHPSQHGRLVFLFDFAWKEHIPVIATRIYWVLHNVLQFLKDRSPIFLGRHQFSPDGDVPRDGSSTVLKFINTPQEYGIWGELKLLWNAHDRNPRPLRQFQLGLRQLSLSDSLVRQLLGMRSGQCHQSALGRGVLDKFCGLFPGFLHLGNLASHRFVLPIHDMPLSSHLVPRTTHLTRLTHVDTPLQEHDNKLQETYNSEHPCKPYEFSLSGSVFIICLLTICGRLAIMCVGNSLSFWPSGRLRQSWRGLCGCGLIGLGWFCGTCAISVVAFGSPPAFWHFHWLLGEDEHGDYQPLHSPEIVPRKLYDALPRLPLALRRHSGARENYWRQ